MDSANQSLTTTLSAIIHFIVLSFRYCTKPLPRIWRDCVQSISMDTCKHGNFEGMHQIWWPHAPVDMGWHYALQQYRLWLQILLWVLFITFWFHTELSTCLLAGDRESMITESVMVVKDSWGEVTFTLGSRKMKCRSCTNIHQHTIHRDKEEEEEVKLRRMTYVHTGLKEDGTLQYWQSIHQYTQSPAYCMYWLDNCMIMHALDTLKLFQEPMNKKICYWDPFVHWDMASAAHIHHRSLTGCRYTQIRGSAWGVWGAGRMGWKSSGSREHGI